MKQEPKGDDDHYEVIDGPQMRDETPSLTPPSDLSAEISKMQFMKWSLEKTEIYISQQLLYM